MRVKVTRIEKLGQPGERISLSMKALEADPWRDLPERLHEGDVVEGRVARLADFGAFVEVLPGVDGLVHVSQVARRRVAHPRDVLQEGQVVAVKVLKIDPHAKRLSLSVREAESVAPGAEAAAKGQVLDGVVAGVKPYGVFVDLPSGQTGLLPRAETETPRGADPGKFFHVGDTVRVAVLSVEPDGKIRLSTKAAAEHEEAEATSRFRAREGGAAPPAAGGGAGPAAAAPKREAPAATGAFAEALKKAEQRRQDRG